jgi:hypothetical protein
MYNDLVYATPGLQTSQIDDYFKDASFGVKQGDVERSYTPQCALPTAPDSNACEQLRIVRDRGFGVPHLYGSTRAGAMFGTGYAAAEDRLFLIDALRHAGRAELSSFAGGAAGNREMDHDVWANQPYTEAELQLQFDRGDEVFGPIGSQIQEDVLNYVDGVNQYIAEARVNPVLKMPSEYAALGRPQGPASWKVTDVIATASLVAGIFGRGGGNEVGSALVLEEARERFGRKKGKKVWADFRSAGDPEAPTTVHKQRFTHGKTPTSKKVKDAQLRNAIETLNAWRRSGAHRRDRDGNGVYEQAEAVWIMDTWWPLLLEAQFKPALGDGLFEKLQSMIGFDDIPRAQGSAYQSGWYGYAQKDLRTVLGKRVKGRYSREYCGKGKLRKCRQALLGSLQQALGVSAAELYGTETCEGGDPQWCHDSVRSRALGAVTQPPMHWINRPTFQQAVEIP